MKYQYLKQRDIIREGDEFYTSYGSWLNIASSYVGKRKGQVFGHYVRMRRRAEWMRVEQSGKDSR